MPHLVTGHRGCPTPDLQIAGSCKWMDYVSDIQVDYFGIAFKYIVQAKKSANKLYPAGPGTEDKDAASVRADACVPFGCGIYYFEVEVTNRGRNGFVGVGFSAADVSLDRLPGWEPHSFGYHGDDGHAFRNSGKGTPYGPTFGTGDVIGVIFDRSEKTISFTKNGVYLGVAFSNVCEERLYPTVGMRTPDEEVNANFGATRFKYDDVLEGIIRSAEGRMRQRISRVDLSSGKQGPQVAEALVFDYLRHHGYWKTAEVAGRDLLNDARSVSPADMQDIKARQHIREAVLSGEIDQANALIEIVAPGILATHQSLKFRLDCHRFMELVRRQHSDEALAFGRKVLGPAARTPQDQDLLQDALTLMAHDNPQDCPSYQQLLGQEACARLATAVNSAILSYQSKPERSSLETIYRQLETVKDELQQRGDPAAALVDFDSALSFKSKRI